MDRLALSPAAGRGLHPDDPHLGGAWFLASWLLPRDQCALWALLPGALIVGLGVGLLQILTITYVVHVVTRKSALYGAIGIALALLLWTYFAGRLLTAPSQPCLTVEAPIRGRRPPRRSVVAAVR